MPRETVHLHFPICGYPNFFTRLSDTNSMWHVQTATGWYTDFPRLLQKPGTMKHKSSKGKQSWETNARPRKLFNVWFPIPYSAYWKGPNSHVPHQVSVLAALQRHDRWLHFARECWENVFI